MTSCIYFLFRGDQILYIGQTTNFEERIKGYSPRANITKIRVIKCDPSKLKEYERRLINYFRPPCNKQHNPDMKFKFADNSIFWRIKRRTKVKRQIVGL